jgi:hypothetical protein
MTNDPDQLDNISAALVAEQFSHAVDLLKAEDRRQAEKITNLEAQARDFETRIRDLTATSTQFKLLASLAMGGEGCPS